LNLVGNLAGDGALQAKGIADAPLVALGPDVGFIAHADELRGDAQASAAAAHAAFEHVAHAELAADVIDEFRGAMKSMQVVRAMTRSQDPPRLQSCAVVSSVRPSLKYASDGLALKQSNGSTAMEG